VGVEKALPASDVLDATGTMVTELAFEAAEENISGVVTAVPNCMGGSAGIGGVPAARELVRGAWALREGDAECFEPETRREWPGCSLWTDSVPLVGLLGLGTLAAEGATAMLCLATGFISKSSWELVEPPELSTGDGVASPVPEAAPDASGIRPVDILLEDRLVRDESMIRSTSLPLSEMLPMSTGL
jgi:hypothetical protein